MGPQDNARWETNDVWPGLGIAERNDQKELLHGGAQQGVSTFLDMIPEKGLAVVMMMNLEEVERRADIARQIADIVLK